MTFQFQSPDPDKIWRLFQRWKEGHFLSEKEVQELTFLAREWIMYYLYMGNIKEAKQIKSKRDNILKKVRSKQCQLKTTPHGVRYANKPKDQRFETCL